MRVAGMDGRTGTLAGWLERGGDAARRGPREEMMTMTQQTEEIDATAAFVVMGAAEDAPLFDDRRVGPPATGASAAGLFRGVGEGDAPLLMGGGQSSVWGAPPYDQRPCSRETRYTVEI